MYMCYVIYKYKHFLCRSTEYQFTMSSAQWPSDTYAPILRRILSDWSFRTSETIQTSALRLVSWSMCSCVCLFVYACVCAYMRVCSCTHNFVNVAFVFLSLICDYIRGRRRLVFLDRLSMVGNKGQCPLRILGNTDRWLLTEQRLDQTFGLWPWTNNYIYTGTPDQGTVTAEQNYSSVSVP
jgi:hypothetical protein